MLGLVRLLDQLLLGLAALAQAIVPQDGGASLAGKISVLAAVRKAPSGAFLLMLRSYVVSRSRSSELEPRHLHGRGTDRGGGAAVSPPWSSRRHLKTAGPAGRTGRSPTLPSAPHTSISSHDLGGAAATKHPYSPMRKTWTTRFACADLWRPWRAKGAPWSEAVAPGTA
eukprot:scaffold135_cov249-Pinguiococcus_pyrenoidosus.AAC.3